jgi:hypothetical protein
LLKPAVLTFYRNRNPKINELLSENCHERRKEWPALKKFPQVNHQGSKGWSFWAGTKRAREKKRSQGPLYFRRLRLAFFKPFATHAVAGRRPALPFHLGNKLPDARVEIF